MGHRALKTQIEDIEQRVSIVTIPNGVDLQKFTFKRRRPGKKIAFAASLRMVKNPMLLIQCMAELWRHDPDYHLHYAVQHTFAPSALHRIQPPAARNVRQLPF
jgi:glycosyltransferase involved in cell wall biosynthesis